MRIKLPVQVNHIIDQLNRHGYEAFVVGGCVRDALLGKRPDDWDITTSAPPMVVKHIFPVTIDTGLKHGTVTVMLHGEAYEVTTYRIDGDYEDHRRPKEVSFTHNLMEDLKRRDFTINAMAYNEATGVVDYFKGKQDLEAGLIRCVGHPEDRFEEDALRMLRAVRFSARFGFEIHPDTQEAIRLKAHKITKISAERIYVELTKTLTSNHPHYMKWLVELGLMEELIPEFMLCIGLKQDNPYHVFTVDEHIYESLSHVEATPVLRWTMFLHDIGKGTTKTIDDKGIGHFHRHVEKSVQLALGILNRLKVDNKTKDAVLKLVQFHDDRLEPRSKQVRRAVNKIGPELFELYLAVQIADIKAQNPDKLEARLAIIEEVRALYHEIIEQRHCVAIKDLAINGKDLMALGLGQGEHIGKLLNQLLEIVLENPEDNTKEQLIKHANELIC